MFKEEILDLLASGKSVDELVAEITNTLNEAKKEYDERVERETAELKRLETESTAKREAMRDVLGAYAHYVLEFTDFADELSEEQLNKLTLPTDEDIDEICGLVESLSGTVKVMNELKDLEFSFGKKRPIEELNKVDLFDDMMRTLGFKRK